MEGTTEQVSDTNHTSEDTQSVKVSKKRSSASKKPSAQEIKPQEKVEVNLRTLLEAGVHFGHQTARWNPQMAPYIYTARNGIHIINLPKTISCWDKAKEAIKEITSRGGSVLFVGTKKQAQETIKEEASRCGAFYVSRRWLGGMLTNFQTIRNSIERMKKLEQTLNEEEELIKKGEATKFKKKERLMMSKELEKLDFSLGGIRNMHAPPQLIFIVDIKREDIAVKEARGLDIPIVALVDTNCSPANIEYPIPSNDDGTRAIKFFCQAVSDSAIEGRAIYEANRHKVVETKEAGQKEKSPAKEAKESTTKEKSEQKS